MSSDSILPSPTLDSGETSPFVPITRVNVPFSAGNPRIEETRGVLQLLSPNTGPTLPAWRKPLLCVLEVPNHMTYADFCMFCGSFIQKILEMRIVRNDEVDDKYTVLLTFDEQKSADAFFRHFNRKCFSSMEENFCNIFFTADVQYTESIEHTQGSAASIVECANCPVCLEKLDQDTGGILKTICNHSFHCSCISNWADSSCPVCRYCQQQPEKSVCSVCKTSENLWMCVICGFVGCGRYKDGHAIRHWKETEHCYSVDLETQRVWDYVGDNYVHRLIQSKTDGKLVELNAHTDDNCGTCGYSADTGIDDTLLSSKVEDVFDEYNVLLTSQLENQRKYFESHLHEIKDETEKKISEALKSLQSPKLLKVQSKLKKHVEEKKFLEEIFNNLSRNKEMWKKKLQDMEERNQTLIRLANDKIRAAEENLKNLMLTIESGEPQDKLQTESHTRIKKSESSSIEAKESVPLPTSAESSPESTSTNSASKGQKRKD